MASLEAVLVRFALALSILLLAGCLGEPSTPASPTEDAATAGGPWQRVHDFEGQLTAAEATRSYPFEVPEGAAQIEALLTWREPLAELGFRLLDPSGEEAAAGWNEAPNRAYVTTTHPVVHGEWTIEIAADRGAATDYSATIKVTSDAPDHGPIAATFTIPPQDPTRLLPPDARGGVPRLMPRDYAEVNLNMEPGDAFRFSWRASAPVYFNVHYHGADGTERPIEERTDALEGSFTANMTEVYALLWRNEGPQEVEITLDLTGSYRLHSMTRRA